MIREFGLMAIDAITLALFLAALLLCAFGLAP
jgi:hypothetical protein